MSAHRSKILAAAIYTALISTAARQPACWPLEIACNNSIPCVRRKAGNLAVDYCNWGTVLRPLLDNRGRITESIRILVPVHRMKQKCVQITTKQVRRSQQFQLRWIACSMLAVQQQKRPKLLFRHRRHVTYTMRLIMLNIGLCQSHQHSQPHTTKSSSISKSARELDE